MADIRILNAGIHYPLPMSTEITAAADVDVVCGAPISSLPDR